MQQVDCLLLNLLAAWDNARARVRGDGGQTLAEYGIVLTVIAVGVVIPTMILFRNTLAGVITDVSDCLNGSC